MQNCAALWLDFQQHERSEHLWQDSVETCVRLMYFAEYILAVGYDAGCG